jgi:hypothetical protein
VEVTNVLKLLQGTHLMVDVERIGLAVYGNVKIERFPADFDELNMGMGGVPGETRTHTSSFGG